MTIKSSLNSMSTLIQLTGIFFSSDVRVDEQKFMSQEVFFLVSYKLENFVFNLPAVNSY